MSNVLFNTCCGVLLVLQIARAVSGKLIYVPSFTAIKPCENFKNENINLEKMEFTVDDSSEDEEKGVGLSGPLELFIAITEEHEISLAVEKCTEVGKEPVFTAVIGICESMKDDDAPWSALFKLMNITACPIDAASYFIIDFKASLNSMSSVLCYEFCGEYEIVLKVTKGAEILSCHRITIVINEVTVDDDK